DSLPDAVSRFLNLSLTTAALRPDLLYSAFWTTSGSLPTITTLPTRSSCAVFIDLKLRGFRCSARYYCRAGARLTKPSILTVSPPKRFDRGKSPGLSGGQGAWRPPE